MDLEFSQQLQEQALRILSSNEELQMEAFFSHLNFPQEPQRSQAYSLLHCCKKHFPDLLFIKLCYVFRCSPCVDTRTMSAHVLRLVGVCDLWSKLSLNAQINIKNHFLVCLQKEVSMPTLRIICGIVSEMVSEIYKAGNEWPELINYLLNSIQSDSEKFQQSALWVFAYLPKGYRPFICEALVSSLEPIHLGFLHALNSPNADIQVTTFGSVVSLIHLFTNSSGRNWFHDLLRAMMVGLFSLLSHSKEAYARGAIKELIMLVMEEPQILKPYLNDLVLDMLKIAENENVKEETKVFVEKFLLTMAEVRDLAPMMRELPHQILVRLLTIPMKQLLYINDNNAWYNLGSQQGENDGKIDPNRYGIAYLQKISTALGERTIAPIAFDLFLEYLDDSNWKKRYAGISMLAVIAEECSSELVIALSEVLMKNYFDQVTSIILKSFQDPHPRVCWAACNFMQLPTTLVKAMQILHHLRIVPALVTALDQYPIPRVKEQAESALLYLLKNVPLDSLRMHTDLDTILSKLQK